MSVSILVVEDESSIAEVLEYNLRREGYEVRVAERGDAALSSIRTQPPSLVILDLMLPGLDGLDVLREVRRDRATRQLPIVVLTARTEEVDRIVGLELGADDYIPKPFSPREVVLRVKAILRRLDSSDRRDDEPITIGGVFLDPEAYRCAVDEGEIALTATEFRLLHLLMRRRGRVQTRERLLNDVWGYPDDVDTRTVDTHIRRLRSKLGSQADSLETVFGVGYRFRGR
jgi:two-component system phosphate regulon response regulator PhoB